MDLVVPRQDHNAINIDMMKRQGMCFNCGVKGHIAARCPKPRKERKFFGRKTELERSGEECYDLEPCVRDFRIYITRSRLRNTTLQGPTIYTCTNMCYVRGRHK